MTTLTTATTQLISSYGNTARNIIHACRAGNERVLGFLDQRWESALHKSAPKLSAEVRGNATRVHLMASSYATQGIHLASDGADALVRKTVDLASKGVQRAATNADQFTQKTGVTALRTLAAVAVPAVIATHKLASTLEKQSARLANRIAGEAAPVQEATVKRVTPFRKARARQSA